MTVSCAHSREPQQSAGSLETCDLVFKGGITSGVVYPPAILQLRKKYSFRHIGGTSAGAIAAAAVAAAEYRRNNCGDDAGFIYLRDHVQQWLGEPSKLHNKDSNLRQLFQANKATKPLMVMLMALLSTSSTSATQSAAPKQAVSQKARKSKFANTLQPLFRLLGVWISNYPSFSPGAALGIIIGLMLFAFLPLAVFAIVYLVSPPGAAQSERIFIVLTVILGILGAWFGWHVGGVVSAIQALPGNYFGICTGYSKNSDGIPDTTNLTGWLNNVLNEMAGKVSSGPLTFKDLKDKKITLKMITSNLSHGLPYTMPEGLHNFIFEKSEMLKLFPEQVVQHMVCNQPKQPLIPQQKLPQLNDGTDGYYYLPDEDNLPVIVCTRMSLSFPVLLSAVPLYTISTQGYNDYSCTGKSVSKEDLQLNWFSDGGICSNFPIQFFDAWLPSRPTFGFNLTKLSSANATSALQESDATAQSAAAAARKTNNEPVYLPKAEDRQDIDWDQVNGIPGFAMAIFGTAQNYHDTMQANLPSYRERIVQIRLNRDEGGLNLGMNKKTIKKVICKGCEAGEILCKEFKLEQHIWVRFRVLMDQLEPNIIGLLKVLRTSDGKHQNVSIGVHTRGTNTRQSSSNRWSFNPPKWSVIEFLMNRLRPELRSRSSTPQISLLEKQLEASSNSQTRYPYWRDKDWTEDATPLVLALLDFIDKWNIPSPDDKNIPCFFCKDAPLPKPVLRVTPEV